MGGILFITLVFIAIIQFILYKRKMSKFRYSENQAKIHELMTALDARKQLYTDPEGRNILMLACMEPHGAKRKDTSFLDVAKKAITTGIRVDSKAPSDGKTALAYAVSRSYSTDLSNFLMDSGADVLSEDNEGKTPLHHAAMHTDLKTLKCVADKAYTIDPVDHQGMTPLLCASERMRIFAIRELLERGANVKHKSKSGETAFSLADKNKSKYYKYGGNSARPDEYGKHNHDIDEMVRELNCLENDRRFKPRKYRPPASNSEIGDVPD